MSLPSKYAPEGLSAEDQSRVITVGNKRPRKPINYIHRTIDDKIQNALQNHHLNHQDQQNGHNNDDDDIEMIPFEDAEEVDVITSYVEYLRGHTAYEQQQHNDMMIDEDEFNDNNNELVEIIEGNISYLILDTNFLISHLKIVDCLKKLAPNHGLKIIIPVYVIQELDGLKNSNKINNSNNGEDGCSGESISQLAKWANQWVYNSLIDSKTIVKGQKLSQRIDKSLIKDDAILDCCLYFKKNHPNSLTIILSNDKNLCSKALMNELLTVSFRPNMSGELIAKTIYNENIQRFGKIETKTKVIKNATPLRINSPIPDAPPPHPPHPTVAPSSEWVAKTQEIDRYSSFESISIGVYNEIQMVLLSALHHCMEEEYGDDLDLIRDYDKDQIVTIDDCANLIIRFWSTVFLEYFRATPDHFLPFHQSNVRRKFSKKTPIHVNVPNSPGELHEFISFWTRVLTIIYDAVMLKLNQDALEKLISRWNNMASKI